MKTPAVPQTQVEAIRYFANEQTAHDFFVSMRWPEGVVCPHCQSKRVGDLSVSEAKTRKGNITVRRVWTCKDCKRQFTAKVGSVFEDSPLPLSKWLPAVWLICGAKNGISSCELARSIGVTQKSAWFMLHRIREAMRDGIFNLCGEVEADETWIGAKARNMHAHKWAKFKSTNRAHQTAVAGLLERSSGKKTSRVKLKIVQNTKRSTVQPNVRDNVIGVDDPKAKPSLRKDLRPKLSFFSVCGHFLRQSSQRNPRRRTAGIRPPARRFCRSASCRSDDGHQLGQGCSRSGLRPCPCAR